MLILARLDQEGFFEAPTTTDLTAAEYDQIIDCTTQTCRTLLWRRRSPYGGNRDSPLVEYALNDQVLAQVLFEVTTGESSGQINQSQLDQLSQQLRTRGLPGDDKLRIALKTIWRTWQQRRGEKYRKVLPDLKIFIDETPREGFLPAYTYLRSYLPVLTSQFALNVNKSLRTKIKAAPPFLDLLRFCMAKEAAPLDSHLAHTIASEIRRPFLRGMAYSYIVANDQISDSFRNDLIHKVSEDLKTEAADSKALLSFDYSEELVHSLSVLARFRGPDLLSTIIHRHYYSDEVLLATTKVWFRSSGEMVGLVGPENLRQQLSYHFTYFFTDKEVLIAAEYLAEVVRYDRDGIATLHSFLENVGNYCEKEHNGLESPKSKTLFAKLFASDAFILLLSNLTNNLDGEDLDRLRHVVRDIPDLLKRLKVLSFMALRWHQLGSAKAIPLLDEIIRGYDDGFIYSGLSPYDMRVHVLPTAGCMHQVSPETSVTMLRLIVDKLRLDKSIETGPSMSLADWSYALAFLSNRVEALDLCEYYLELGRAFATDVVDWQYETIPDRIGRDLEEIKNGKVIDSLFIFLRSAVQFQQQTESYQTALAHATAHFAKGMVNTSGDALLEIMDVHNMLRDIQF